MGKVPMLENRLNKQKIGVKKASTVVLLRQRPLGAYCLYRRFQRKKDGYSSWKQDYFNEDIGVLTQEIGAFSKPHNKGKTRFF
jgi:hypothetical protein